MSADALFERLQSQYHALNQRADSFSVHSSVASAKPAMELRNYAGEVQIEAWIDVELHSGDALTWWAEISRRNGLWEIEVSLLKTNESGQTTLRCETLPATSSEDILYAQFCMQIVRAKDIEFYIKNSDLVPLMS